MLLSIVAISKVFSVVFHDAIAVILISAIAVFVIWLPFALEEMNERAFQREWEQRRLDRTHAIIDSLEIDSPEYWDAIACLDPEHEKKPVRLMGKLRFVDNDARSRIG